MDAPVSNMALPSANLALERFLGSTITAIQIEQLEVILKHSRWPKNRTSIARKIHFSSSLLSLVNNKGGCPYFIPLFHNGAEEPP
jgi:hypothetical protein